MKNQHQEIAMPSASFANAELQEFIDSRPDAREVRKALAVATSKILRFVSDGTDSAWG